MGYKNIPVGSVWKHKEEGLSKRRLLPRTDMILILESLIYNPNGHGWFARRKIKTLTNNNEVAQFDLAVKNPYGEDLWFGEFERLI